MWFWEKEKSCKNKIRLTIHLIPQEWDNDRVYQSSQVLKFSATLPLSGLHFCAQQEVQTIANAYPPAPPINGHSELKSDIFYCSKSQCRVHSAHGSRVVILRMNARPPSGRLCLESAAEDLQSGSSGHSMEALRISSSSALSPKEHQTNEFMVWYVPGCDCMSVAASGFTWSLCCADGGPGRAAWRSDGSSDSARPAFAPWRGSFAPAPGTSCSNWRWGRTWSSASVNIQCEAQTISL